MPPTRRTGRNNTHSMTMSLRDFRTARRSKPGGTTSTRAEAAAPQPAGGGVAHETRVERATARRAPTLEDGDPTIPAILNKTRPTAVIIALLPRIALRAFARGPASCLPRGSPRKLPFDRNSQCVTLTLWAGFEQPKIDCQRANNSRPHPLMSVKQDPLLMTPGFPSAFLKIHKR